VVTYDRLSTALSPPQAEHDLHKKEQSQRESSTAVNSLFLVADELMSIAFALVKQTEFNGNRKFHIESLTAINSFFLVAVESEAYGACLG
jgi:hypothetical protein